MGSKGVWSWGKREMDGQRLVFDLHVSKIPDDWIVLVPNSSFSCGTSAVISDPESPLSPSSSSSFRCR